ncbi:hypothetical protein EIY71_18370, partial [Pseudomonas sp. CH235]
MAVRQKPPIVVFRIFGSPQIVPTLCVGMPQRTLRVRLWKGRGASRAAFPRRAWERSPSRGHLLRQS